LIKRGRTRSGVSTGVARAIRVHSTADRLIVFGINIDPLDCRGLRLGSADCAPPRWSTDAGCIISHSVHGHAQADERGKRHYQLSIPQRRQLPLYFPRSSAHRGQLRPAPYSDLVSLQLRRKVIAASGLFLSFQNERCFLVP
jgi:hypothetical protein